MTATAPTTGVPLTSNDTTRVESARRQLVSIGAARRSVPVTLNSLSNRTASAKPTPVTAA